MENSDGLKLWQLSEKLTILQAALLVVGLNPGKYLFVNKLEPEKGDIYESNRRVSSEKTANFRAAYHAIVQAGKSNRLKIEWSYYNFLDFIDADSSYVLVEDLKEWLLLRGLCPSFFSLRIILLRLRIKNMRFKIQRIHVMLQSLQLLLWHGKR
ncbi:hypothetical protein [Bartonella sp. AU18XJBT]|uniref:hypothetical protein n=1 Tax=Bartonella sp. AU18XJBT TaxID=3019089 RepID=UPI002362E23C|nr:hypothetical protein [Bartonella sp. AU18XJBT]